MFNPYDFYITPDEYEEAGANGISRRLVNTRIRGRGWDKQRAITTPPQEKKDRSAIVEKARQYGVPYNVLMARIHLGWDEDDAATRPVRDVRTHKEIAKRMCELNRKYPLEMVKLAKKNGIKYSCFQYRVSHGWEMNRAATTTPTSHNAPMRLKEIYGEDYLKNLHKWLFQRR